VLVPRDLPIPDDGVTWEPNLATRIAAIVRDEDTTGQTIEAALRGPSGWCELVQGFGAEPRPVGGMLGRGARWLGFPVLALRRERTAPPASASDWIWTSYWPLGLDAGVWTAGAALRSDEPPVAVDRAADHERRVST
jgi:hypothetical protein